MTKAAKYDQGCTRCSRLVSFLKTVKQRHPDYWCAPVPAFGATHAALLIVGLAPGMHGANASGRPFTGDYAGILLYQTLHQLGLASAPVSDHATDGLKLLNCRVTNAVKCLPPQNKPTTDEVKRCNAYLKYELEVLRPKCILALGTVAHAAVLRAMDQKLTRWRFAHGEIHTLSESLSVVDSYHCSRYNTQTRRLTPQMFYQAVLAAAQLAGIKVKAR